MFRRIHLLTMLCVAAIAVCGSPCHAMESSDVQYRTSTKFSVDLGNLWKAVFIEDVRFETEDGDFVYHHSDLAFVYSGFADWLDVGFNFRLISKKDSPGKWEQERRPHLNLTIKDEFRGIKFSTRSRFEFRDRYKSKDMWRYRNKFTFKLPWELTALRLKPYLADEVFINFNREGYVSNRVYSGLTFDVAKDVKADIYCFWQSSRADPGRDDTYAIGAKLGFSF